MRLPPLVARPHATLAALALATSRRFEVQSVCIDEPRRHGVAGGKLRCASPVLRQSGRAAEPKDPAPSWKANALSSLFVETHSTPGP